MNSIECLPKDGCIIQQKISRAKISQAFQTIRISDSTFEYVDFAGALENCTFSNCKFYKWFLGLFGVI